MNTDTTKDNKPSAAEKYSTATHTNNLRVSVERAGAADVLIAMGWSPSRLGAALMRLHSEWDGCEKPRRPIKEAVDLLALSMERVGDKKTAVDYAGAHAKAHDWYMHELKILFGKLKTMPEVRQQLVIWAQRQHIENPEHRAAEVLGWWLDHVCPACEGRGKERIPGTPSLSLKACKVCRGSGERRLPNKQGYPRYEAEAARMLQHISVCVCTAQTALKKRLQVFRANS